MNVGKWGATVSTTCRSRMDAGATSAPTNANNATAAASTSGGAANTNNVSRTGLKIHARRDAAGDRATADAIALIASPLAAKAAPRSRSANPDDPGTGSPFWKLNGPA